jgi:hypothetical protein
VRASSPPKLRRPRVGDVLRRRAAAAIGRDVALLGSATWPTSCWLACVWCRCFPCAGTPQRPALRVLPDRAAPVCDVPTRLPLRRQSGSTVATAALGLIGEALGLPPTSFDCFVRLDG